MRVREAGPKLAAHACGTIRAQRAFMRRLFLGVVLTLTVLPGSAVVAQVPAADDAPSSTAASSGAAPQVPPLPGPPNPVASAPHVDATDVLDGPLLAAMLHLEEAVGLPDPQARALRTASAVQALAAIGDPRAVPLLLRLSRAPDVHTRLSALSGLTAFVDDARALYRLQETMLPQAPADESTIALPALLDTARRHPGQQSVPCPEDGTCGADVELLSALLAYVDADETARPGAVNRVGALRDTRATLFLWRMTFAKDEETRLAGLRGLAPHVQTPRAKERLLVVLEQGTEKERQQALAGLAPQKDDETTEAILAQRRKETSAAMRSALEAELRARIPEVLDALLEEERRLAEELAKRPSTFDTTMRGVLTAAAGVGAAAGSAAAASVVADTIEPNSGACYGIWGACAGGASAAAVGWFGLGDNKLGGADVALALSTGLWGAFAGTLIPPAIGPQATEDGRHMVYAGAGGHLLGMTAGTIGAILARPSALDVAEMNAVVLAADALVAGSLLLVPTTQTDPALLARALSISTLVAAGGAAGLAPVLRLQPLALGHTAELAVVGAGAGLALGGALQQMKADGDLSNPVPGAALAGAAIATGVGLTLGQFQMTPTWGGMVYEGWAALAGGALGTAAGLVLDASLDPGQTDRVEYALLGTATGVVAGAASTAFFPAGVPQDTGDLVLQPLFVAFAFYHSAALAAAAEVDGRYIGAAGFAAPALVSAGLVFGAPFIDASWGDVLMVGSMMGFSAYGASMGLLSASQRNPDSVPTWAWILGTSLAMDVGIAAGIALDLSNIDDIGWRTTYVAAVAAGTTLVLSLPGALLASSADSPITVPDVLLAASVLGAGIGFVTMPLIDFRIATDWGLGKRPSESGDQVASIQVTPTLLALPPLPSTEGTQAPLALGFVGSF